MRARKTLLLLAAIVLLFVRPTAQAAPSFSTVVIDPGHGGFDRGGIPHQRVPEKVVALETALRLQKILQRAGLRTIMTRSTDVFVPLPARSAIANAQADAIFVSVHYNASPRSGARGIETYSEENRGAVLAARIQRHIITRVSTENRGVRHAEYFVLRKCKLPAVLVECGFLTNPYEAQLAQTPNYQQQVAEQIAAGILEQRQFAFPPPMPHRGADFNHSQSISLRGEREKTLSHGSIKHTGRNPNSAEEELAELDLTELGYLRRGAWWLAILYSSYHCFYQTSSSPRIFPRRSLPASNASSAGAPSRL